MPQAVALKRQRPNQDVMPAAPMNNSKPLDAGTLLCSVDIISRLLNQISLVYDSGEKYFPLCFNPAPLLKAMGVADDDIFEFPMDDPTGERWVTGRRRKLLRHLFSYMDIVDGSKSESSSGWGALIDDDLLVCSAACQYYSDRKLSLSQTATLYHRFADHLADLYISSLNYLTQCLSCVLKKVHLLNIGNGVTPLLKGEMSPSGKTNGGSQSQEQHMLTSRMTQLLSLIIQRITCWPSPLLHSRYSLLYFRDPSSAKKHWREIKPHELRLQTRVAAEVRQIVGFATPITWLSLMHLIAFFDVSTFKSFQRGISIMSRPPLTDVQGINRSTSLDTEAPFPPLDRLAIRTRTKYKFTFANASAIREGFYWWNTVTLSTRICAQGPWRDSIAWSEVFNLSEKSPNTSVRGLIKCWQIAIVRGQLDCHFVVRHILRVIAACSRERREVNFVPEQMVEENQTLKPVTTGNINIYAVACLIVAVSFFGEAIVKKEFLKLLRWHRDMVVTRLAHSSNSLAELMSIAESQVASTGLIIDDPIISLTQKKSVVAFHPSRSIPTSDVQSIASVKLNSDLLVPDAAVSTSGLGVCAALLLGLRIIEFDDVWPYLPPDDYVSTLVARIHKLCLHDSASKARFIDLVEQCDFDRSSELWFKAQLVKYFTDIQKKDSMDVLLYVVCPRLELLAAAAEFNLKSVCDEAVERFKALEYPFHLSRIVRKGFGSLIGSSNDIQNTPAIFGYVKDDHWITPRAPDDGGNNGILDCYGVLKGWTLGNAEVVNIICEELTKRPSTDDNLMIDGPFTSLLLLPTPQDIPPPPSNPAQPLPTARNGDSVSHQVSDIIWQHMADWSIERRFKAYADFYFRKLQDPEIKYLCVQDRNQVSKSLKKITASTNPNRTWEKADKSLSAAVCRGAMNNPFETFSCILHNVELFDQMWLLTALDYLRVLTRLACDILLFMMVVKLQGYVSTGISVSMPRKVKNLSLFAARFLRKFPWVCIRPLVLTICGGVFKSSQSLSRIPDTFEHIYLGDLLTWLGGCGQTGMAEITQTQMNCYFGGPVLRSIALTDESIRIEEFKPGAKQCKNNLRDILLESNVFRALVFGLGKLLAIVTMNSLMPTSEEAVDTDSLAAGDDECLSKILETSNTLHSALAHLLDFVISSAPLAVSTTAEASTLPSRAYRIFPPSLWQASFRTLPNYIVWQLIRWASPPCLVNVNPGQHATPPRSSHDEMTEESVQMQWFSRSTPDETSEFLQFVNSYKPRILSADGFLSYWMLQAGDVRHPDREYLSFLRQPEMIAAQLGAIASEASAQRKVSEIRDALEKEHETKRLSTEALREWFVRNARSLVTEEFVANDDPEVEINGVVEAITKIILPRSSWSLADSLFSYQWLSLMVECGNLDVATVTLGLVSCGLPFLFGCTDMEADCAGLLISTWLVSLSGFTETENGESQGKQNSSNRSVSEVEANMGHNETRLLMNVETVVLEVFDRVKPTWLTARRILRWLNQVCSILPVSQSGYKRLISQLEVIEKALQDNREIMSMTKSLRRRLVVKQTPYLNELVFNT